MWFDRMSHYKTKKKYLMLPSCILFSVEVVFEQQSVLISQIQLGPYLLFTVN